MSKPIKYSSISGQDNWRLYKRTRLITSGPRSWDWAKWKKTKRSWADELRGMVSRKLIRAFGDNAGHVHRFQHAGKTYYYVAGFRGWDYQYVAPKYRPSQGKRITINDIYVLNKKGKQELVKRGFIKDFKETLDIMAEA